LKQRYQNLREQSIVVLREAQARGDICSDMPAEELAIMLFAMLDGLQVQWLYESEQMKMARLAGTISQGMKRERGPGSPISLSESIEKSCQRMATTHELYGLVGTSEHEHRHSPTSLFPAQRMVARKAGVAGEWVLTSGLRALETIK
jgi:hypothetical protein